MRTTLTIDDDILAAAKVMAAHDSRSVGQIISDLARKGLRTGTKSGQSKKPYRTLPKRNVVITMELVNALRDETS